MLLPDNIHPEHSIYYNGAFVLQILQKKKKIELLELFQEVKEISKMSFSIFTLCLDWLYLIDIIKQEDGKIELCS
jgi:hypothetical protein